MSRTSHKLKIASQHALNEQFEFLDDNQMQSDGKVACRPSTFSDREIHGWPENSPRNKPGKRTRKISQAMMSRIIAVKWARDFSIRDSEKPLRNSCQERE